MQKTLFISLLSVFCCLLSAQTPRSEIGKNIRCSASSYLAYPGPTQHQLTPPPTGMKPFFISHYGRYGSRYHTRPSTYDTPYHLLAAADSAGKLTPLGRDVLHRLDLIRQEANLHWGELTELGAEQHRQIVSRMYERFPEVFTDDADIEARSTTVGRCILSMEHALLQLLRLNPRLTIHHNATVRDRNYLDYQDRQLIALRNDSAVTAVYRRFNEKHEHSRRLLHLLFNDRDYARQLDATQLCSSLFTIASNIQSSNIRKRVTLYDLYTDEELYQHWLCENASCYVSYGNTPISGNLQPYSQRFLLRQIIEDADRHIRESRTGVTLRFGSETALLPLCCLLDVNGCGLSTNRLESLGRKRWVDYRLIPMAANIQLVFYRKETGGDVLFKVLLNENEATLPLRTLNPPYYHWDDFKTYYLKKLEAYEKR